MTSTEEYEIHKSETKIRRKMPLYKTLFSIPDREKVHRTN